MAEANEVLEESCCGVPRLLTDEPTGDEDAVPQDDPAKLLRVQGALTAGRSADTRGLPLRHVAWLPGNARPGDVAAVPLRPLLLERGGEPHDSQFL